MSLSTSAPAQPQPQPQPQPPDTTVPGFLTISQLARVLGISEGAAYMRIYRGRDKYRVVKIGHSLLVPQDVVMRLFQQLQQER